MPLSTVGPPRVPRLGAWPRNRPRIDAVVLCHPVALAGQGTSRQLQEAWLGLTRRFAGTPVHVAYVGAPVPANTIGLADPLAPVEPVDTGEVPGRFRAATAALTRALRALREAGARHVAVVCAGYTAYGPEAVKRALDSLSTGGAAMKACVFLVDSAYPDTDARDARRDRSGWPRGRFFAPAYESTAAARTAFLLTSAYAYDPWLLNERAPEGLGGVGVISPPYTDSYLRWLEATARRARIDGGADLYGALPGFARRRSDDLLVPLVASDVWSPSAVGAWMTRKQHESCRSGTESLIRTLVRISERLGRRIWVPIDVAGAEFVSGLNLPGVAVLRTREQREDAESKVLLPAYRGLSQADHATLLAAARLAVSRTGGQANATAVLAVARTPNFVLDMPACGYMQSELTSLAIARELRVSADGAVRNVARSAPLGWLAHWKQAPQEVEGLLWEALTVDAERARRANAAYDAFHSLRRAPGGTLVDVLADAAGVGKRGARGKRPAR